MHTAYETHQPVALVVEIGRGSVTARAVDDLVESTVEITGDHADEVQVDSSGDTITIVQPQRRTGFFSQEAAVDVVVDVPRGSRLSVKTGSAPVDAAGTWAQVRTKTGSGDVRVERVDGAAALDTGSGDLSIRSAGGDLRIKSGSGDVQVDEARASLVVSTGSGDVRIGRTDGASVVKTGSGDLTVARSIGDLSMSTGSGDTVIEAVERGVLSVKAASGDVVVGVPRGVPLWSDVTSVSGRIASDLESVGAPAEGQDHIELRARTVSGDVALRQI